jgi:beta-lactamase regulating signal transducer with metallopeptidase domain
MMLILLNTTIKISLIVMAALATTSLLRRQSAAVRHFILAAALVCAAATPFVRVVAPAWQSASRLQVIDRPLAVFDDSGPAASSSVVHQTAANAINTAAIMRAIAIIWIAGVVLAVAVLVVGLLRLRWIASHARPVVDGPWADAARDIARAYGLRRTPIVLHSDHRSVLGTWGITRAKVLLPADALEWPSDRIRIVLAHELAHVRRGDWMVQMAVELLCAAYWFNPLVWLAARRLRLESEQACDDAVLTSGVEGSAYASELVDLARAFRSERQLFVPAAAIARPSSLERRVRAMLNVKLNRDPITRTASIAAAIVLAAVTVVVAGFGVSAQGQFASVAGTIVDQNGKPINAVRLVLANDAAQTKNEVKSDAAGHYEFVGVPSGTYTLMFESAGMAYLKREGLNVAPGQTVQVNAVMKIGSVSETISVTSAADNAPPVRGYTGPRPADKPDPCAQSAAGGCIRPPVKIKDVRPVYPAGTAPGSVELTATIDANGYVTNLDVVGNGAGGPASIPQADAAAVAVSQWEFLPTHLDGQPIETNMTVHVYFNK